MTKYLNCIQKIVIGCLSVMILASCGSHEQKGDDAFERVKEKRMLSKDSNFIPKIIIQEPKKPVLEKKKENPDEWTKYKYEIEKKINTNENKIKEIRELPNVNANLLRKVTNLEKTNNDLRMKMDEYNEAEKVKWEKFKVSMNHSVNEIGIELKSMKIDNKK